MLATFVKRHSSTLINITVKREKLFYTLARDVNALLVWREIKKGPTRDGGDHTVLFYYFFYRFSENPNCIGHVSVKELCKFKK